MSIHNHRHGYMPAHADMHVHVHGYALTTEAPEWQNDKYWLRTGMVCLHFLQLQIKLYIKMMRSSGCLECIFLGLLDSSEKGTLVNMMFWQHVLFPCLGITFRQWLRLIKWFSQQKIWTGELPWWFAQPPKRIYHSGQINISPRSQVWTAPKH